MKDRDIIVHFDKEALGFTQQEEDDLISRAEAHELAEEDPGDTLVPLLDLYQAVIYPKVIIPLNLGNKRFLKVVKHAYRKRQCIAVVAKQSEDKPSTLRDFHPTGTLVRVLKILSLDDQEQVAVVQGLGRISLKKVATEKGQLLAQVKHLPEKKPPDTQKTKALAQALKSHVNAILDEVPNSPEVFKDVMHTIHNFNVLVYYLATYMGGDFVQRQTLLNTTTPVRRGRLLLKYLVHELAFVKEQKQLAQDFHLAHHRKSRNMRLREQIAFLQKQLGQDKEAAELAALARQGKKKQWPKEVATHFAKTLERLEVMTPQSGDYHTHYLYAKTLLDLPWAVYSKDNRDFAKVATTLARGHYGMEKIKERILEFLATYQQPRHPATGNILCLWGPPGTGKTSIARNIAKALGRKFASMALGGLYDEATLRGHRKTYVGAMPGNIITMLQQAGTANPVILLDEVEKLNEHRGKLDAVLLEILDPDQNKAFKDTYVEMPFDLSQVLFITTANDPTALAKPLKDRMELIEVGGYAFEEKVAIAKKYILPKKRRQYGLQAKELALGNTALSYLITGYTSESGVRGLTRQVESLCRKAVLAKVTGKEHPSKLTPTALTKLLGPPPYEEERYEPTNLPGVATGLAWTSVGGTILVIESTLYPGEGKLTLSGQLGEVMEESAFTAQSYLKTHAQALHIDPRVFKHYDLHIHLPEGATPKDGPSAGITLLTALASLYTQRSVKQRIAMTGEITLRGTILPVGGIKEKLLAARRAGCHTLIMSKKNKKDVEELKPTYQEGLTLHYLAHVAELLPLVLEDQPYKHARTWQIPEEKPSKRKRL